MTKEVTPGQQMKTQGWAAAVLPHCPACTATTQALGLEGSQRCVALSKLLNFSGP